MSEEEDLYQLEGALDGSETKRVLKRLEEEAVRFEVEADNSGVGGFDRPSSSAYGGDSGLGSYLRLYIHKKDLVRWRKIRQEFYPL